MAIHRIVVFHRDLFQDVKAADLTKTLRRDPKMPLDLAIRTASSYLISGDISQEYLKKIRDELFIDPVIERGYLDTYPSLSFEYAVEVGYKPGVTDNTGQSAVRGLSDLTGLDEQTVSVFTSTLYFFSGLKKVREIKSIILDYLCNPLVSRYEIIGRKEWRAKTFSNALPVCHFERGRLFDYLDIKGDKKHLEALSRERCLSLSAEEMKSIRDHYSRRDVITSRREAGLDDRPTELELEVIAQTWSEHCKHKIFNARIRYLDEKGRETQIDSLYRTYIQGVTRQCRDRSDLLSVFDDNAGVFRFDEHNALCLKVETHNSPSALDPYGGAMTGIVGVNRDILGTGLGARPIFNTDVFCFAPPDYAGEIPRPLLPPRRIFAEVHRGIRDGGNQSGIPTINGAILFDDRFLGKPLVFCGTGGILPMDIRGRSGYRKRVSPGDRIVMVGGRIGKDGIHGATFSSSALTEDSPSSAVQIGNPIIQRKMLDFLLEARDGHLYRAITDNGAGGLSSSVGEMARETGGCTLHLERAPLKYPGLKPWEILVSEAQERMTLAVPPDKWPALQALAERRDVEVSDLGVFENSGSMTVHYESQVVGILDMDFLHNGLPIMKLEAVWTPPVHLEPGREEFDLNPEEVFLSMLARPNIASKERWVRQYDHEVLAQSVIKPFEGRFRDGPSDAAVIAPVYGSRKGLAIACGINPFYGDIDPHAMAMASVDEAVRNAVAVGGNPDRMVALDNFCWPDPVTSEETPDGRYKLAQLVRANQGLHKICLAYNLPLISGKDSMKNDYSAKGKKISVPPTLLVTVAAIVDDIEETVTSFFKHTDSLIYLLGPTRDELGGGELLRMRGFIGNKVPRIDPERHLSRYRRVHDAMVKKQIESCHDLNEGGLSVTLAEMAIGGRIGCRVDLRQINNPESLSFTKLLYSESQGRFLLEIKPSRAPALERHFAGENFHELGKTTSDGHLTIGDGTRECIRLPLDLVRKHWQGGIDL